MGTFRHRRNLGTFGNPIAQLACPAPGWLAAQQVSTPPVTFNFVTFTTLFPEFLQLTEPQGDAYFMMAQLYCPNSAGNPFLSVLPQLLYLATAHCAWLFAPRTSDGLPGPPSGNVNQTVGRINTATEGSVTVGLELDASAGGPSEAFFTQTKYGFAFWQATASIRTARYAASPTFVIQPWMTSGFWSVGFGLIGGVIPGPGA